MNYFLLLTWYLLQHSVVRFGCMKVSTTVAVKIKTKSCKCATINKLVHGGVNSCLQRVHMCDQRFSKHILITILGKIPVNRNIITS